MISNNLLQFAAKNYGFEIGLLTFLCSSKSHVYRFYKQGKGYILRLSKRPIENVKYFKAEMDWLCYLAEKNMGVPVPLKTNDGEIVISTQENGENYIITAYSVVSGKPLELNDSDTWRKKMFYCWGKEMGTMHYYAKEYKPANNNLRQEFTCESEFHENIKSCPFVGKIMEGLLTEFMSLPKDKESYGLIHYDMHPGNFYMDDDKVNVFDFDDSIYGWFALDIGIALYYALCGVNYYENVDDLRVNNSANVIIESFIEGYIQTNYLDDFWVSKIPKFMKLRYLYTFDPSRYLKDRKTIHYIKNDIFFNGCDLKKLSSTK